MDNTTGITQVSSADGTVYLHTHDGLSSAEIVTALRPYVGRMISINLPNNYGHVEERRVRLTGADGTDLTVYYAPTDYTGTHDAMSTAGLACVKVQPVREWSAKHYGESRPACGATVRDDDTCTTVIKNVRCTDCLEEVNRNV